MKQSIRGLWEYVHGRNSARCGNHGLRPTMRLYLEPLEDRVTPTTNTILASGVISGFVLADNGAAGLPGVNVTLMGTTTTGRNVDISATTDGAGGYAFTDLLPGTYSVSRGTNPDGFIGGNITLLSDIAITQGQSSGSHNLSVGGLAASRVSLALFISGSGGEQLPLPPPGTATSQGFTLNSANPLANQSLSVGTTSFLDLSGNFFDPNTTDTTVTFNTSQGSFNVQLFDTVAPQTVTNFLDYIQAGAYNSDLFHRMANLSGSGAPQILQGGGFSVTVDKASVTALPALTTVFQAIMGEFNAAHPDGPGTLAMALTDFANSNTPNPNSATNEFFFNLTDNSTTLGPGNGPFTVFGQVTGSGMTILQKFASNYVAQNVAPNTTSTPPAFPNSNAAFNSLPFINGVTPPNTFPTGVSPADLAIIDSITVATPSNGHLTYSIVGNSNPGVVTATLGQNASGSTFSANQLQLVAVKAGTSVITIQVRDNAGEAVNYQLTVTAS